MPVQDVALWSGWNDQYAAELETLRLEWEKDPESAPVGVKDWRRLAVMLVCKVTRTFTREQIQRWHKKCAATVKNDGTEDGETNVRDLLGCKIDFTGPRQEGIVNARALTKEELKKAGPPVSSYPPPALPATADMVRSAYGSDGLLTCTTVKYPRLPKQAAQSTQKPRQVAAHKKFQRQDGRNSRSTGDVTEPREVLP